MMKASQLQDARVIITGATGFIGGHLARSLIASGAHVYGVSRGGGEDFKEGYAFACDIVDQANIKDIVEEVRPTCVFHLAANKARKTEVQDFRQCFDENLIGTLNLLEACVASPDLSRFITIGTCEEYGGADTPYFESTREVPVSAYSCSKVAMTQLLQTYYRIHGFPVVVLRPSLAYGPGQGDEMFLPALIRSLLRGQRFPMSRGEQTRDYVYIDDVVEALLLAAVCPEAIGQVINISSGMPTRIVDVARLAVDLIGNGAEALLDIGKIDYRPGEAMNYWADRTKAKQLLGWEPGVGLRDGMERTVEYYKSVYTV